MAEAVLPYPAEEAPEGRRRRRFVGLLFFWVAGLAVLLIGITSIAGYYLATRKSLTELPAVQVVTRALPPTRLFTFAVGRPVGIAVSPDSQRIYVAEGGGERYIKVFDRDGRPIAKLAAPESKPGTRKPGHLAVEASGRLYVNDRLQSTVETYSPSLEWEGVWLPPIVEQMGGWIPNSVAVGEDGRIYVSETGREQHSVLVFQPDKTLFSMHDRSTGLPGGLNYPTHATADADGRIYITDGGAGRILVIGKDRVRLAGIAGEEAVGLPMGQTIANGRLLVADAAAHRILGFALGDQPKYLHGFGDTDDEDGMTYPTAVTMDGTGRVYVTDRSNDRVQVWTY